jgi:two-component sensor histidine kinase
VNPDQKTLSLQVWSTRTVSEFCTAEGKGLHYTIDQAGVWVDCVRQRQTVIHNDYQSLPHKKGMPPGHAPVKREVVVPIFREDKIVAILGVGNKPRDYTQDDARLISYCADIAWEMTERKRAEEQLEKHRNYLEELVKERTAELTVANDRLKREIVERKKGEQKLRNYAETQKVLVREVNHRVKNNLSAIIGMLHMEEDRAKTEGAIQYLPSLQDLICRIDGLATVHSLLSAYDWRPLEVDELCRQVVGAALKGVPLGRRIRVKVMSSKIQINSNQAHHLTLIINELATNTMKYAFGSRDEANIAISSHQIKRSLSIVYRDDGPGYPERILQENHRLSSIGFELIRGIVSRSLNGTIEFSNDDGAMARIMFNNELNQ